MELFRGVIFTYYLYLCFFGSFRGSCSETFQSVGGMGFEAFGPLVRAGFLWEIPDSPKNWLAKNHWGGDEFLGGGLKRLSFVENFLFGGKRSVLTSASFFRWLGWNHQQLVFHFIKDCLNHQASIHENHHSPWVKPWKNTSKKTFPWFASKPGTRQPSSDKETPWNLLATWLKIQQLLL